MIKKDRIWSRVNRYTSFEFASRTVDFVVATYIQPYMFIVVTGKHLNRAWSKQHSVPAIN